MKRQFVDEEINSGRPFEEKGEFHLLQMKTPNTGYRLEKLELSVDLSIFRVIGSQDAFLGGAIFY